jgi:hypothetical protein
VILPVSSSATADDQPLTARERRVSLVADRQGLALRRSGIRSGGEDVRRYDLIFERYNQPVATDLELTAVEVWLGIRETTSDSE